MLNVTWGFILLFYLNKNLFTYKLSLKRFKNLGAFESLSFKLNVRQNKFCINKITRPTANSIADKTKKKKVNDKIFKLSYKRPTTKVIPYKTIQMSSAVKSRCRAVFVLIKTLNRSNKKKTNNKFNVSTIKGGGGKKAASTQNRWRENTVDDSALSALFSMDKLRRRLEELKKNDHFA